MTVAEASGSAGILISLNVLIVQRTEEPVALEEAPVALRRIGWIGRPILLVGHRVAGRDLPRAAGDREAWVRDAVGPGAYAVVAFEEPVIERTASADAAIEQWRMVAERHGGAWLVTDRARQVGPAQQAGLKVILIGPSDGQPWLQRPDYPARDLRDAVGHLLAADVFAHPGSAPADRQNQAQEGFPGS